MRQADAIPVRLRFYNYGIFPLTPEPRAIPLPAV
jgi:hypothetical protein